MGSKNLGSSQENCSFLLSSRLKNVSALTICPLIRNTVWSDQDINNQTLVQRLFWLHGKILYHIYSMACLKTGSNALTIMTLEKLTPPFKELVRLFAVCQKNIQPISMCLCSRVMANERFNGCSLLQQWLLRRLHLSEYDHEQLRMVTSKAHLA